MHPTVAIWTGLPALRAETASGAERNHGHWFANTVTSFESKLGMAADAGIYLAQLKAFKRRMHTISSGRLVVNTRATLALVALHSAPKTRYFNVATYATTFAVVEMVQWTHFRFIALNPPMIYQPFRNGPHSYKSRSFTLKSLMYCASSLKP